MGATLPPLRSGVAGAALSEAWSEGTSDAALPSALGS